MSSTDILEERVAELERKVYGTVNNPSIDDPLPENSVIDNLLNANTMISSALSSREKANNLVKRLSELNELLSTSFDEDLQTDVKWQIIETMEPEIRQNLELIAKATELLPVLEVDAIKNVPELTPKLEHLTLEYLNAYEESTAVNQTIKEVFSKYNAIIDTISKTLVALDSAITAAELSAIPKKQLD
ncbi:dynactin subunit 3-like [Fopius arisanus]|uniref:Dynactin subunit 3-like n=1 Tax=Fopius arisanus TaxID=64838 RepID=A0A9R1TIB8_9HYME|nr:PREDICTED: dynactin subunit 3-like [Fopius arisanus]XP_011309494.1 PREDICTED: dynactin subunit 3-like [Fopius arisanus]